MRNMDGDQGSINSNGSLSQFSSEKHDFAIFTVFSFWILLMNDSSHHVILTEFKPDSHISIIVMV